MSDHLTLHELEFESQTTYTFVEEIGRGGMGVVYLASRNSGGVVDYVVLKTLKSLPPASEKALREEANIAASLRHENIVKTFGLEQLPVSALPPSFITSVSNLCYTHDQEVRRRKFRRLQFRKKPKQVLYLEGAANVQDEKLLLMVVDYVDGMNLQHLHEAHLNMSLLIPVQFGAFIISRIARGLGYAHNYLIHDNISPENILVNTHGICKLSDFALSAAINKQANHLQGRLSYLSPEHLAKQRTDERSDIFALGAIAYEILTGIPLFKVDKAMSLQEQIQDIQQQISDGIIAPHKIRNDIPVELSEIIEKMLSPTREMRYQRAVSVANDFEKKYLYSKGYGPTNNSLANYLAIFENRFTMYTEDQLENLSFLKTDKGDIQLKRRFEPEQYTELGTELFKRQAPDLYKRLRKGGSGDGTTSVPLPWVKVRHLDNVIESFILGEKPLIIGSDEDAVVHITDESVQGNHCTVHKEEDSVYIKQSAPQAEVLVNLQAISEKQLREGDKIKVGDHSLFFIKQGTPQDPDSLQRFTIESGGQEIPKASELEDDFIVTLVPQSDCLTPLVRLVSEILKSTDLSELKVGVIPSALIEALQLLKDEDNTLNIRFMRTPARMVFYIRWITPAGYEKLLSTFKQHRKSLTEELEEQEAEPEVSTIDTDFFKTQDELSTLPPAGDEDGDGDEDDEFDEFDEFDEDFDFGNLDVGIIAARILVHSFDRIEFKKDLGEVELVVFT